MLKQAGSPYWLSAEHYLARTASNRRDLSEAIKRIDVIANEGQAYPALAARAEWLRGIVLLQDSKPAHALRSYRRAATAYTHLGETENAASVLNSLADTERVLGEIASGWRSLGASMAISADISDPTRRYLIFFNANLFSLRSGLTRSALIFQNEAVVHAGQRAGSVAVLEALINRAQTLSEQPDSAAAAGDLGVATSTLAKVPDPIQRAYMAARIHAVRAETLLESDAAAAAAEADKAMMILGKAEPAEMPRMRWLKATAMGRLGRDDDFVRELDEGIAVFERRLAALDRQALAASYADEGWSLYQLLIDHYSRRGEPDKALQALERVKSNLDHAGAPLDRSASQKLPPQGTAVVQYAWTPDGLRWWVLEPQGRRHGVLSVRMESVEQACDALRRDLRLANPTAQARAVRQLQTLYDQLIRPLDVSAASLLVVIPDGPLHKVPFSALADEAGNHVAESAAIVIAPRVTTPRGRTPSLADDRSAAVMVITDPAFREAEYPELERLPSATSEGQLVRAAYESGAVINGPAATPLALLDALQRYRVIHYAGHAVVNEQFPELSRLVMAPADAGSSGDLRFSQLLEAARPRTDVLVLAACDTATGTEHAVAGPLSIARAFLSTGVPAVVASLWPVDDQAGIRFWGVFHMNLRSGATPAEALRRAQVEAITSGDSIAVWAPFAVYEGTRLPST